MTTTTNKSRVLIADDHAILRAGLRMLISAQPDMEVCAEAGDSHEAVVQAERFQPHVAVMDITMPAGGGIRAIELIRRRSPHTRCLVLSMHADSAYVRTALTAGAIGYISKQAVDTELIRGIRAAAQGQTFIDPALAGAIVEGTLRLGTTGPAAAATDPLQTLSGRERQVLTLLVRGHTNQRIADQLFVSVKTTETYRARLSRKLGLRSRADFIRYGLETGLLSPGQAPPDLEF